MHKDTLAQKIMRSRKRLETLYCQGAKDKALAESEQLDQLIVIAMQMKDVSDERQCIHKAG